MPMKPKPNKHDRRSYNQSPGGSWRELDRAQEQTKKSPGPAQSPNGILPERHNNGVAKKSKPKVFSPRAIERSIIKALEPVLQARDGTVYTFSDWTLSGDGVVIVLPNGQEFWLTITEAK